LNAPVGACAKQLALKGPLTTISTGDASGLAAIAEAAHLLATRDDLDRVVAGGVEEDRRAPEPRTIEGSVTALLSTERPSAAPIIRLAGWGVAGPDDAGAAVRAACARAERSAVGLVVGPAEVAGARTLALDHRGGAAASALGFAIA